MIATIKNNLIQFICILLLLEQSPRKTTAATPIDGASPTKMFKPNMDQAKDDGFTAIKNVPTMKFDPQLEPLLRENPKRFVIFPIKYHDIWAMYKKVSRTCCDMFLHVCACIHT